LLFTRFARWAAHAAGRPQAFIGAAGIILIWAIAGPIFKFTDTWQLVINTGTTIVTFLMVFLIQNTQNRDAEAMQIKLDELIRAVGDAHNALIDLEEISQDELDKVRAHYQALAEHARGSLKEIYEDEVEEVEEAKAARRRSTRRSRSSRRAGASG
jgi:low affinity Fe/Cu permease